MIWLQGRSQDFRKRSTQKLRTGSHANLLNYVGLAIHLTLTRGARSLEVFEEFVRKKRLYGHPFYKLRNEWLYSRATGKHGKLEWKWKQKQKMEKCCQRSIKLAVDCRVY